MRAYSIQQTSRRHEISAGQLLSSDLRSFFFGRWSSVPAEGTQTLHSGNKYLHPPPWIHTASTRALRLMRRLCRVCRLVIATSTALRTSTEKGVALPNQVSFHFPSDNMSKLMLSMCKTAVANVTTVIAETAAARAHLQPLIATSRTAFLVTSTTAVTMTAVIAAAPQLTAWAHRLSTATSRTSQIPHRSSSTLYRIP